MLYYRPFMPPASANRYEPLPITPTTSYTRTQAIIGGDVGATLSWEPESDYDLGQWWDGELLGYEVVEMSADGRPIFGGQFSRIMGQIGGYTAVVDIKSVFNHVIVKYKTGASGSSTAYSTPASHPQSIARYGQRSQLHTTTTIMSATSADDLALALASAQAYPQTVATTFSPRPTKGQKQAYRIQLDVTGWWHTLTAQLHTDIITGPIPLHTAIITTLGSSPIIAPNKISPNALTIDQEVPGYVPIWGRLTEIAAMTDLSGRPFALTVSYDKRLDYQAVDTTSITHYATLSTGEILAYDNSIALNELYPTSTIFIRDITPSLPIRHPLSADPRVIVVSSLTYQWQPNKPPTISLRGMADEATQLQAVKLAYKK